LEIFLRDLLSFRGEYWKELSADIDSCDGIICCDSGKGVIEQIVTYQIEL
jgi:hypothetical protein